MLVCSLSVFLVHVSSVFCRLFLTFAVDACVVVFTLVFWGCGELKFSAKSAILLLACPPLSCLCLPVARHKMAVYFEVSAFTVSENFLVCEP